MSTHGRGLVGGERRGRGRGPIGGGRSGALPYQDRGQRLSLYLHHKRQLTAVGLAVGSEVRGCVGEAVGSLVGVAVGAAEGSSVGASVGACQSQESQLRSVDVEPKARALQRWAPVWGGRWGRRWGWPWGRWWGRPWAWRWAPRWARPWARPSARSSAPRSGSRSATTSGTARERIPLRNRGSLSREMRGYRDETHSRGLESGRRRGGARWGGRGVLS
jgi:hypothetical protein